MAEWLRVVIGVALLIGLSAGPVLLFSDWPPLDQPHTAQGKRPPTEHRPSSAANQHSDTDNQTGHATETKSSAASDKTPPPNLQQQPDRHRGTDLNQKDSEMDNLSAWATFAVTVGILIVAGIQARIYRNQARIMRSQLNAAALAARATRRSAEISQKILTLTQRPRIKIRDIEPDFTVNKEWYFHSGNHVTGDVWIGNAGGSTATVKVWGIHVIWSERGLPPAWPAVPSPPYDGSDDLPILNAGVHTTLKFQSGEIMGEEGHDISTGRGKWRLFLLGRITYADDLGITRTTAFCRQFDKPEGITGRFIRVDDPDLEYDD
jgi:hypothetical protein